ncbi:MAG: hypothetical protein WBA18_02905 [Terracidiphilus sp.]
MANRNLSSGELILAHSLLDEIRGKLSELAAGDPNLLFAYRRKVYKELIYLERGKPMARRKVKLQKFDQQNGKCAHCNSEMKIGYSELDRKNAVDGYTFENTELLHADCHRGRQAAKGYS